MRKLAAQDGGGLFIFIYLVLVLTFGFTLLTTDIALGHRTKQSALKAFGSIHKKWDFLGKLTFLVPVIIMTYYSVIGGWVTKYIVVYLTGKGSEATQDGYFISFITSEIAPIIFMLIFLAITAFVVYSGVEKGVEKFPKLVMPVLLVMIVGIAVFSLTLKHTDADGITRTGLQGLAVYLIPDFTGLTFSRFLKILLDAMSQLFFSLSVSMGIMITYGSYVKDDINLNKSISQIEFFDTGVALLAGMMVIPAVYVFSGTEGMASGPSLMFTSLVIGAIFAAAASIICMGYNVLYFEVTSPNGSTGQLLDIMDYISNSFLMPLISFLTCVFVRWIIKPQWSIDEMESSGHTFTRKKIYRVMIRYVAPVIMAVLFLQSMGLF